MAPLCDHLSMLITAPCVVALTWRLEDAQNQLIDELAEPVEFFYGGDDLLAGVEDVLAEQEVGFATKVQIEPEEAFGAYDPELLCYEARTLFPEGVEPGMQFEGLPEGSATQGMPADAIYTVTEVYPEHVVLDANHPLAGMALRIALQVRGVREATPEEIKQRSVGPSAMAVMGGPLPGDTLH
jgi:FKBP-type peptidyl-prolyl cis-trans isomerase SlyD